MFLVFDLLGGDEIVRHQRNDEEGREERDDKRAAKVSDSALKKARSRR